MREATQTALAWRIADIHVPERLTVEQRNLARHGFDHPMDPERFLPLPSERLTCARTMTWAEATTIRDVLITELEGVDEPNQPALLLALASWRLAVERYRHDPQAMDVPLPQEELQNLAEWARATWIERDPLPDAPTPTPALPQVPTPAS